MQPNVVIEGAARGPHGRLNEQHREFPAPQLGGIAIRGALEFARIARAVVVAVAAAAGRAPSHTHTPSRNSHGRPRPAIWTACGLLEWWSPREAPV